MSPRPWSYHPQSAWITDANGDPVATFGDGPRARADARFMVQAVNAFQAPKKTVTVIRQTEQELRAALARHNIPTQLAMIAKLTAIPAARLREFLAGTPLNPSEHMTLCRYAFAKDED